MIRSVVTGGLYSTKESARVAAWHWQNREAWYASRTKSEKKYPLKKKVRAALWNAVKRGRMLPARALPCWDCRNRAEIYDHFKTYRWEDRFVVQAVCMKCSIARDLKKGRR